MNGFIKTSVVRIAVLLMVFVLSGCMTDRLSESVSRSENGKTLYKNDTITAAAVTKMASGTYRWVFIGNAFDYSVSSGADDLLVALATKKIDSMRIKASRTGVFVLDKDEIRFNGSIALTYAYRDSTERAQVMEALQLRDWECRNTSTGAGTCNIRLKEITGDIHRKAAVPTDALRFTQPIAVSFYTRNGLSAKRALYPIAVATDVVLSPVYLIGGITIASLFMFAR